MHTRFSKPLGWVALVLIVCVTADAISALSLWLLRPRLQSGFREAIDSLSPETVKWYQDNLFDPDLGWDYRPNWSSGSITNSAGNDFVITTDATGARTNTAPFGEELISVFGDSFTLGYEVNDDETWPHFLSYLTETQVRNFAVPSYGADQTFLKFSRLSGKKTTSYVLLAYIWDDFSRSLASYHGFESPSSPHKVFFKPRIHFDGQRAVLIPSPLPKLGSKADALQALEESKKSDLFYRNYWRFLEPGPLSSYRIFRWSVKYFQNERVPQHVQNAQIFALFSHIVAKSNEICASRGCVPVQVFLPTARELSTKKTRYDWLIRQASQSGLNARIIDVGKMLAQEVDAQNAGALYTTLPNGHPSPRGHELIARLVLRQLIEDHGFPSPRGAHSQVALAGE